MFHLFGRFITRAWLLLLAAWVVLLVALWMIAPAWEEVSESGQFSFLPKDSPSNRGKELFKAAFPDQPSGSNVVIVLSRGDEKPIYDDRDFIHELKAGLIGIANQQGGLADPAGSGQARRTSAIARVQTLDDTGSGLLLVNGYQNATLVVVDLTTEFMDKATWPTLQAIEDFVERLRRENRVPEGLDVALTGSALVGRDIRQAEKKSVRDIHVWTIALVIAILLLIYRAPLLALVPLATVFVAVQVATKILSIMAQQKLIGLSETNQIYITVLAYGAGVDYCLFLMARYREELEHGVDLREALANAIGKVGGTLTASAATVICGIAMLLLGKFGKYHQAGITIPFSLFIVLCGALTFAPVLLRSSGHWAFWPGRAVERVRDHVAASSGLRRFLSAHLSKGIWEKIGNALRRRPGTIWLASVIAMAPLAAVAVRTYNSWDYGLSHDVPQDSPSFAGNQSLQHHFPAGFEPITVLIRNDAIDFTARESTELIKALDTRLREHKAELKLDDIRSVAHPLGITATARDVLHGVKRLSDPALDKQIRERALAYYVSHAGPVNGHVTRLELVTTLDPMSRESIDNFTRIEPFLREELPSELAGSDIEFTGPPPALHDLQTVTTSDLRRIEVAVPVVILVILVIFLREVVASVYLVATVLFSYLVTLGMTYLVFWWLEPTGFLGLDWKVPIFLFTILIAVGEDYNIFLMTRVKEERARHGPVDGVVEAVVKTGGIISSCGFIMAGTFASLLAGSLLEMKQLGFALAFGVLLDTLVVRPLLVPAFLILLGRRRLHPSEKSTGTGAEVAAS
jgi:RND superfamily putative drug exporter